MDYEYDSYNYYKKIHGTAPEKELINAMANTFLRPKRLPHGTYGLPIIRAGRILNASCSRQAALEACRGISGNVDIWIRLFTVAPQTAVKIDTTIDVKKPSGDVYTFKVTCDKTPAVSVGNSKVAALFFCRRDGNNYFYHLFFCGKPGDETGIYTATPGEAYGLR